MLKTYMKRWLATFLCLAVFFTAIVPEVEAQKRKRRRLGQKQRTAAIIGGGAVTGAVIAGPVGALVGAGAATVYSLRKRSTRRAKKRKPNAGKGGIYTRRRRY